VKVIIYIGKQTDSFFSSIYTAIQDAIVATSAFNRIATSEALKMCVMVFSLSFFSTKEFLYPDLDARTNQLSG
jgi:hypothetical protein